MQVNELRDFVNNFCSQSSCDPLIVFANWNIAIDYCLSVRGKSDGVVCVLVSYCPDSLTLDVVHRSFCKNFIFLSRWLPMQKSPLCTACRRSLTSPYVTSPHVPFSSTDFPSSTTFWAVTSLIIYGSLRLNLTPLGKRSIHSKKSNGTQSMDVHFSWRAVLAVHQERRLGIWFHLICIDLTQWRSWMMPICTNTLILLMQPIMKYFILALALRNKLLRSLIHLRACWRRPKALQAVIETP